jgi:hypothetical protein
MKNTWHSMSREDPGREFFGTDDVEGLPDGVHAMMSAYSLRERTHKLQLELNSMEYRSVVDRIVDYCAPRSDQLRT